MVIKLSNLSWHIDDLIVINVVLTLLKTRSAIHESPAQRRPFHNGPAKPVAAPIQRGLTP